MAGEALRIDLGTVADAAGSATVFYDGASVSVACRLEAARRYGLTIDCEVEAASFDASADHITAVAHLGGAWAHMYRA